MRRFRSSLSLVFVIAHRLRELCRLKSDNAELGTTTANAISETALPGIAARLPVSISKVAEVRQRKLPEAKVRPRVNRKQLLSSRSSDSRSQANHNANQ